MIQKIIPIAASITLIGSASLTVYADNMLDKDYIVREIWSDWWNGNGDDGLIFPEASYKHHILTEWVNDNYGDDNYDWSKVGQLNYNFKDYYDELTDNWNFNLQNGKWLMSDDNGNVIDSFIPFSTLTEDTAEENRNSVITDDGNGTAHRVGENLKIEEDTTVGVSEEATKPTSAEKSSNGLIYGIGGMVLAGFLIKKKRG